MINTALTTYINKVGWRGKDKDHHKISPQTKGFVFLFFISLISGVCLAMLCCTRPIFASEIAYVTPSQQISIDRAKPDKTIWQAKLRKKYGADKVSFVTDGVAHIKLVKYVNNKPVKVNVIEVNPNLNKNLVIKPQIAGTKLNSKATISTIAKKEGAIVAMNGGYFKPQTGVPLGTLMVNGKFLTGPIYNRVGIGIAQNEGVTSFSIGKTSIDATVSNDFVTLKADNINQPRMLSTYVLIYTPEWGDMVPIAPKYGANVVIDGDEVVKITANAVSIPKNGYIVSGPKEKVYSLIAQKNLFLRVSPNEPFKDATHIIAGGPYLIKGGELYIDINEEKLTAITGNNPRSAIGYNDEGEFMLVTVDGREKNSVGMSLGSLARLMKALGCTNAINLDGGGSSVLYVNGEIKNSPAQKGGIPISNALLIVEEK